MKKSSSAFTTIELLIVIVVIAILAAITIAAYNGIQNRAKASAQASLVSQTEKSIASDAALNGVDTTQFSGTLLAYQEGVGETKLAKPITGAADITMYAVYDIYNTSTNYSWIAGLTPTSGQRFVLDTNDAGTSLLRYRIDTSAETNRTSAQGSVRLAGTTVIGWLQTSAGATNRSFAYNKSAAQSNASLAVHTSWNFTALNSSEDNAGSTKAALVFTGAHDQATRLAVIQWLAKKYNVSGTFS